MISQMNLFYRFCNIFYTDPILFFVGTNYA